MVCIYNTVLTRLYSSDDSMYQFTHETPSGIVSSLAAEQSNVQHVNTDQDGSFHSWTDRDQLQAGLENKVSAESIYPVETTHQSAQSDYYTDTGQQISPKQDRCMGAADVARTKRRSKQPPHPSQFAQNVPDSDIVTDADINDYTQILKFKIRKQGQQQIERLIMERDAVQQELQHRQRLVRDLQDHLHQTQQDKDSLASICDQQQIRLTTYETKLKRFKVYIDGLGNDFNSLKRDANATRRKSDELLQEVENRKADREQLLGQMHNCTERSTHFKNEVLRACSEAQRELREVTSQSKYLDEQLGEKVGLLTEERDRRTQLERRLLSASETSESISRALKANHNAVLDKLHIIHAALETVQTDHHTSDMVKRTLEAVQGLNSSTASSANDATSTKLFVEALSERYDLTHCSKDISFIS